MSQYRGTMGNVRQTMEHANHALGHLAEISRNVANAAGANQVRRSLGALGATSWTSPGPVQEDFGAIPPAISVTQSPNGNRVVTLTDGTVMIFNAAGQDVTANYIHTPAPLTAAQRAAIALDDTTGLATGPLGATVSNALSSVGNIGKSVLVLAVVVGVVYAIHEAQK